MKTRDLKKLDRGKICSACAFSDDCETKDPDTTGIDHYNIGVCPYNQILFSRMDRANQLLIDIKTLIDNYCES